MQAQRPSSTLTKRLRPPATNHAVPALPGPTAPSQPSPAPAASCWPATATPCLRSRLSAQRHSRRCPQPSLPPHGLAASRQPPSAARRRQQAGRHDGCCRPPPPPGAGAGARSAPLPPGVPPGPRRVGDVVDQLEWRHPRDPGSLPPFCHGAMRWRRRLACARPAASLALYGPRSPSLLPSLFLLPPSPGTLLSSL